MKQISFWLDQPYDPRPPLETSIETDVLVIGGGITGVSAAYHCSKSGLRTALIEKESIASGSAGKNGGMIVEGFSCDFLETSDRFGETVARSMWNKTVEAAALAKALIREHSIDCDLTQEGSLYASLSDDDDLWLEKEAAARKRNGILAEMIPKSRTPGVFTDAIFNAVDAGIHPVNFVRGLAKEAEKLGTRIYESTPAVSWNSEGALTPRGSIRAKRVVLALESSTPNIEGATQTLDSLGIMTEPLSAETMSKIFPGGGEMLWTTGQSYICVRKYKDRLFLNGEDSGELVETFLSYFTDVRADEIRISHAWHGPITYPNDLAPLIEEVDGVIRVYGQGGNGLTNGIISGRDVAALLA